MNQESGFTDEVVVVIGERLQSRRSYESIETADLHVVSVAYRWRAGFS